MNNRKDPRQFSRWQPEQSFKIQNTSLSLAETRAEMKLLLLLLLGFLSAPSYARMAASFFPVFGPSSPPESLPITPSPTAVALPPSGMQVKKVDHHYHLDRRLFLAIVIMSAFVGLITLVSFCILIYLWRNLQQSNQKSIQDSDAGQGVDVERVLGRSGNLRMNRKVGIAVIEYALIDVATNSFSDTNGLGEGGFGRVYKARFSNNVVAAVKRLDSGREDLVKEFENELQIMNQVQHPNIVSLLGYCVHGQTRILVYELMANGSLEIQLHGHLRGSALSWHMRMKIALDAARGLEYLHDRCNPPVVHRDLKSANILLDSNFNAKLSDFGLAITGDQNKSNIKLSGTVGYLAPEYLIDGKLTEKSDVYAFGVVLLELLMGKKPVEEMAPSQCQSIVSWAMPQLTDRSKLPDMIDPVIRNTMDLKHLYQVAAVAVLCVQPEPSYRPLITDVLHSLIPLVPIELGGTLRVAKDAEN